METQAQQPQRPVWQWPRVVPATALNILLGHLAIGATNASWIVVEFRAEKIPVPWLKPYFWELTGTFGAFLAFPIVLTAVLNAPRPGGRWGRFLRIHGLAYALYALLIPVFFLSLRYLLNPLLGWGPYEYGPMALKLPMEWIKLLVGYVAIAFGVAAWLNFQESQRRARQEAELKARLQEARLQALSAQLDPHFLFNALNTVSSLMYEDLARTDSLLASLGQMLRNGLEAGGPAWQLQRELQHLDAFLAFAEARFGDRLRIQREVQGDLGRFQVPRFCLQRLAENALKHNLDAPDRVLHLRLSVSSQDGWLCLEAEDDGVGFPGAEPNPEGAGLGLRNLGDVLGLLYGGRASLQVGQGAAGGARVALRIPEEGAYG